MRDDIEAPCERPCPSCPYRRDAPSGLWAEDHYDMLAEYDKETFDQPAGVFMCHLDNGHLCAGWASVHDMENNLGLRLAASQMSREDLRATLDYVSPVPVFDTGAEAAEHGLADLNDPDERTRAVASKIVRIPGKGWSK